MTETSSARDIMCQQEGWLKWLLDIKLEKGVCCNLTRHGHNPTSDYGLDELQYICTITHTKGLGHSCYI